MGPHRIHHQMKTTLHRKQAGVTALGFLFLAAVFGILGFAVIKLIPLYMQNLRLTSVMNEMASDTENQGMSPGSIRVELDKRLDIEGMTLPREDVTIRQASGGYQLRIQHEARTPFIAGIWFLLAFDKQVEIKR